MELSSDLLSQFVKATNDEKTPDVGVTVEGTARAYNDKIYVQLDGSDQLTPVISSTAGMKDGDRVTVLIKDHTATVTGNVSSPSASQDSVDETKKEIGNKISEFEIVIADKVDTSQLNAEKARIDDLVSKNVTITEKVTANEADIKKLTADNVTINKTLTAQKADIDNLEATKISADIADAKYATIKNLEATDANVHNLQADYAEFERTTTDKLTANDASIKNLTANKLDVTTAETKYANIDFANIGEAAVKKLFSDSGIIKDLVVSDGHITGELVGVTIKGDIIEGGTVIADKLVVKGENGLFYKLNTDGVTTTAEQTEYNSLNGRVITAKSITAEKINVDDLVAFKATIGGYHITASSLYSGTKSSASNTTRGVYMNKDGEFATGDSNNYLRFYKASDGKYKLEISAASIKLSSGKTVETAISDAVSDIQVGGRNLSELTNTDNYPAGAYGSVIGGPHKPTYTTDSAFPNKSIVTLTFDKTDNGWRYIYLGGTEIISKLINSSVDEAVLSFDIRVSKPTPMMRAAVIDRKYDKNPICAFTSPSVSKIVANTWTHVTYNMTINHSTAMSQQYIYLQYPTIAEGYVYEFVNVKLELGNKATDWTPAPEDVELEIDSVQSTADSAKTKADANQVDLAQARSELQLLSNSIASLVTDSNGSSLMTQTSDGWTFNIGSMKSNINKVSQDLNRLEGDVASVDTVLNRIESLSDDIAKKTAYITMTQDENGAPCIELGKVDNDFKVRITNESIDFVQGSQKIAYITNRTLYIQSSVVTNTMQIGESPGWVWARRANGNLGLRWVE